MWLHHQNNYKFGTGANNKLCFYSPSLKMQKPRHLLIPISLFTICVATLPILNSENPHPDPHPSNITSPYIVARLWDHL